MNGKNIMSKQNNTNTLLKVLGIGIALVQIFDVIIHAASDQLEPLRVSSNVIILVWLAIVISLIRQAVDLNSAGKKK
jgi:hypothetical protein